MLADFIATPVGKLQRQRRFPRQWREQKLCRCSRVAEIPEIRAPQGFAGGRVCNVCCLQEIFAHAACTCSRMAFVQNTTPVRLMAVHATTIFLRSARSADSHLSAASRSNISI